MCGIVGYVGNRPALDVLLKGLKRLEYRGYDSAGVAFFLGDTIHVRKSEGKIANVERLVEDMKKSAPQCGIGHTRWATHGRPTTQNAHPHRCGHVVLVHNGIIENYLEIKAELVARGHAPISETDSELFGFLVLEEMEKGLRLFDAVRTSFKKLHGACSVVVMSEKEPGILVGIRNGSPLVAAKDEAGGAILASDAQPIIEYAKEVVFLENGDVVVANNKTLEFFELESGKKVSRPLTKIEWSVEQLDRRGYPHYMLKEIFEQPMAIIDTMNGVLDRAHTDPFPLADQPGVAILNHAKSMSLIACGTSWHASLVGKYWLERWAGIRVDVDLASEFRYRDPVLDRDGVVIGISQSGETADTLAVIREMRKRGVPTLGITNVRGSTLSREANAVFYTSAGPEIGVAATKSFSCQLAMFLMWAGSLALKRGRDTSGKAMELFEHAVRLPHLLEKMLTPNSEFVSSVKKAAAQFQNSKGFFFIGRGYSYPIALEGALKLKEIAYVHAEGYAAGELKHGPIAMLDENMTIVVLAPRDSWREKTLSNVQEVKARKAKVLGIGNADDAAFRSQCDGYIGLDTRTDGREIDESLYPFLLSAAVQLLSYEIATLFGTEIDQPRNLAKSVTVE